jgi:DNA-binding transcriptional ArsR family regulator
VGGGVGPVFDALGDPGRRELIQAVSERGSATATELASARGVTRQAVAKQLATLADAGLLRARREGRETRYEVTPAPFAGAVAWISEVGGRWDDRLAALGAHLDRRRGQTPLRRSP